MNRIGSGLSDDVDDRARADPVLGGKMIGGYVELLYGIRIGKGEIGIQIGVVMPGAVHLEIDSARAAAADVPVRFTWIYATLAVDQAIFAGFIHRARRQIKQ